MYDHIQGIIFNKTPTQVVLQANGVGYLLNMPVSAYDKLPSVGEKTLVYTYLNVREDQLSLFGFVSQSEREVFLHLISVNGIGPMTALRIMSGIEIQDLVEAVQSKNIARLSKVKGVGKKTAERIILELGQSLGLVAIESSNSKSPEPSVQVDAIMALVTLGYSQKDAKAAVEKTYNNDPTITVDGLIREVLKVL